MIPPKINDPSSGPGRRAEARYASWYRCAMLLAPRHGFVFLAMPRAASTSIEQAFRPYAELPVQKNPFKHTTYEEFQRFVRPYLEAKGFGRDSYEVVCAVREPIDWLNSWWRYRSREELADPSHRNHQNYAGHVSFEQFVRAYVERKEQFARLEDPAGVRRPADFVRARPGQPEIDRVFRFDRLDLLVEYLREKVGREVKVRVKNVAPERSLSLSGECERELRAFFAPEYEIYEGAEGD